MDFVVAAANLRAELYGIPKNTDRKSIAGIIATVHVEEFQPKTGKMRQLLAALVNN